MSSPFLPRGIFSAQWIPTDDQGALDRPALHTLLEFERQHGIHGVLALGSTGEFPYFTIDARKRLLAAVAEIASPLPVIANVTDIRPTAAIELGCFAASLGLPAIALMPPSFYPMSAADMLAHFLHVAEHVPLPVMLYNFPELTGKRIEPETVAAFAQRAPMCAIKQSGSEFSYHQTLVALGREHGFVVMSGADTRLPEAFALGAAGCIGGLVNIVPDLMVHVYRSCVERGADDVEPAASQIRQVGDSLNRLSFPLNVGAGITARGLPIGQPKRVVSPESHRLHAEVVDELRRHFAAWGLSSGASPLPPASAEASLAQAS